MGKPDRTGGGMESFLYHRGVTGTEGLWMAALPETAVEKRLGKRNEKRVEIPDERDYNFI